MSRPYRILTLLLGTAWAQALIVAGIGLILTPSLAKARLIPAAALLGAGCFVAMWLVIDKLVPDASPAVVVTLKLTAALAFWAGGSLTVYAMIVGRSPTIPLPI